MYADKGFSLAVSDEYIPGRNAASWRFCAQENLHRPRYPNEWYKSEVSSPYKWVKQI